MPDSKQSEWTPSEFAKVHGANWTKWLGHLKDVPACGIELGTWEGDSAEWALANILTHPLSQYICVDTFEGSEEHRLAGIDCSGMFDRVSARLQKFGNRADVRPDYSHHALLTHWARSGETIDFAYIDAAHDAMNVLRDSVLVFELLKAGGIMIWDDYTWNVFPQAVDCPKIAIDSFLSCYARQLEVIALGYQVCVRKTA